MMWSFVAILALMIPLTAVVLDSKLGRALASRLERKPDAPADAVNERMAALEAEVDRLGVEVRRLEDQSEFLQRLLEGKPARDALPPTEDS